MRLNRRALAAADARFGPPTCHFSLALAAPLMERRRHDAEEGREGVEVPPHYDMMPDDF